MAEKSVAVFDNSTDDFYDRKAPKSSQQLYESIDLEKFDHVKADKNKNYRTATSAQKMGLRKLYYDTNFFGIETRSSYEFYTIMSKPNINKIFKNALSLLQGDDIVEIMYDDFKNSDYIELSKNNAPILYQINNILKILKINSLLDTKTTFSTTDVESNYTKINKCLENLKVVMKIRTKKTGKQSKLKNLFDDFNNILHNWCGAKVVKINDSRKRIRENGTRKEIYNYKLDYVIVYKDKKKCLTILDIVRSSTYFKEI